MGSYYVLEGPLEELMFVDASLLLIVSCHDVGTILCCRVLWFYWEIEAGGAAGCVNQVLEHFPVSVAKELQTSSTEYCKTTHMTCIQGGAPSKLLKQKSVLAVVVESCCSSNYVHPSIQFIIQKTRTSTQANNQNDEGIPQRPPLPPLDHYTQLRRRNGR